MNEPGLRRTLPEQFSESGYTFSTTRHQSVTNPILSKRVCFYKSGDPQFNGLQMVINNRTFKTFDALLDSLSKKVPLPFGVRNITTPRGVHAVCSLDELEDGKSYICSDRRKVKPINLAVARKKPTPWYHARPVSARRRTIEKGRKLHNSESVVMRTPKKLLVFRNGDPAVKCVVVLQKKTTPTFESILRYISELMQFGVAKLHTPEGRRVDGLPGLIMCSGTVVAAGKEKFQPANYVSQKSVGLSQMKINRRGVRRLKALNHKKRLYAMKPRILSPSSERYIVSQIQNTIGGSLYSMPTNSIEMESSHVLESVAESEAENFSEAVVEGQGCLLPADDDIEKSFRVNQDGSMTVEMKVRLTIKEEETLHWTTTLSRSCVSNQLTEDSFLATEPEEEINQPESDCMDLRPPTATTKDINKNKDICNEEPTSISNSVYNQGSFEADNCKAHEDLASPLRTPSPKKKQFQTKHASVESITSLTAEGFQEDTSYFREHLQNGELTEHYCMLKHTNSRPIPKPRRVGSVDINISTYKSAEVFQMDSSGEEITETVMHIYEQQTCQDNFLANICAQGMSTSAIDFCRPATSDTGHHSTNSDFQPEQCRPSTASEPVSLWRSESLSLMSNLTFQSQNTSPTYTQPLSQELIKSQNKDKVKVKEKRVPPKHKVTIKRLKSPGNKVKESKSKKDKPFTSARFISKIYGNKSKSKKNMTEHKKKQNATGTTKGTQQADAYQTGPSSSEPRENFTQQTSVNQMKLRRNSVVPLPVMSNSGTNGYVEDWLEKSQSKQPLYIEGENESHAKSEKLNLENDPCLMSVAEKVKSLKEKPKTSHSSTAPLPELTRNGSVRQKVKCFEKKSEDNHHSDNPTNNSLLKDSKDLPTNIVHKSGSIIVQFEESSNTLSTDHSPPPAERLKEFSSPLAIDASADSSPLYQVSSVSDIHPLSTSPTSDRAISPTERTIEMVSSIQTDNPLELREAPLQRAPSIKRAPLVSNLSLERKMSLKKASLDEYTIPKESTPFHIHTVADNSLENRLISKSIVNVKSSQSNCSSASPASLTSDHRTLSTSVLSNETPKIISQSNELGSPKPLAKKVILVGSPSPERKHQTKKTTSEVMNKSPRLSSMNDHPADKNASPSVERKKGTTPSASPASEKRQILNSKSKLLKKTSPYSQSLDLASSPVKHKISQKSLYRNISTDSALGATNKTPRKRSSQKRTEQAHLAPSNKSKSQEATTEYITNDDHESDTKVKLQSLKITQMVLEKLCFSISAIRQMTQHRQNSCKEASLPDFSSHVSATFGSSSKVLLAFLSVITLKEITPKLDAELFNANDVNCAEALDMIDSLREIASIDEPQTLQMSLSHLRQSASQSLLQSWRGFQKCCDKIKSHNCSPKSGKIRNSRTTPEQVEAKVFNDLMDNLGMPEMLRTELASFSLSTESTVENYKDVTNNNISGANDVKNSELNTSDNQLGVEYQLAIAEREESRTEEMLDSDCYVELNVGKPISDVSLDSESETTSASDADRMQLVYSSGMEVHSTVNTSTDIDEMSFSEDNLQDKSKELNGIVEEPLSDEEQETSGALQKQQTDVDVHIHFENDHSSCEDNSTNKNIISRHSNENEIRSEEGTGLMSGYIRKSCNQALLSEENIENIAKKLCDDIITQSVCEHVTSPKKKVANGLKRGTGFTTPLQREVLLVSDGEESSTESPISLLSPSTCLTAQSSLAFSYDSSNVITKQPEGNRVKSIREMFLAKSALENVPKMSQSPKTSEITELRAETSVSGGYQSQTSSELSSGEDDSARKSITKGFVMRTIERLYGKKESPSQQDKSDRPLSANKQKKKDQTGVFSPFHAARSKTVSELSYFNSSNAMDALSEATRCIAFNAQVGPADSVHTDNDLCFLQENPVLRKSVSDPVVINLTTPEKQQPCKDTEEKTPYLLFKTDSEDEQKSLSRKCTYFSLPHANDSDAVQEESVVSADIKGDICCESKDSLEDTKVWSEKNGKLLSGVTDFKIMDNKVHPLVEMSSADEAVVVQPVRGQGVINRRLQEPDVLDILYNFCGEHCPIL